jgi:CheY-like chemotaxis protein
MAVHEPILRVLCVDDNRDAADTLGILLEIVGFEVKVCYDGPSALAAAETFRPDAAILDLTMPGMDGDEVGRRLRARPWGKAIPLVALTALSGDDARRRTEEAGFDLHLTKPVAPDRLANVLADIVILRGEMTATVDQG